MSSISNAYVPSGSGKPTQGVKRLRRSFTNMSNRSLTSSFSISSFTKENIFNGTKRPKRDYSENEDNLTSLEVKYTGDHGGDDNVTRSKHGSMYTLSFPAVRDNGDRSDHSDHSDDSNDSDTATEIVPSMNVKVLNGRDSMEMHRRSAFSAFTYSEGVTMETQQSVSFLGMKDNRYGRIFEPWDEKEAAERNYSVSEDDSVTTNGVFSGWQPPADGGFLQRLGRKWQSKNKGIKTNIASVKTGLMKKFQRRSVLVPREVNMRDTFSPIMFDPSLRVNDFATRPRKVKPTKVPTMQPPQAPPMKEREECVLDTGNDNDISGALLYILNNTRDDEEVATDDISRNFTIDRPATSATKESSPDLPNCKLRIDDLPDEMKAVEIAEPNFIDIETLDDTSDCPVDYISII